MRNPVYSAGMQDRIVQAYMAGASGQEVAAKFGCHPSYPCRLIARRGLARDPVFWGKNLRQPRKRRGVEVVPKAQPEPARAPVGIRTEILRLKGKGLSITAIAAIVRQPYRLVAEVVAT